MGISFWRISGKSSSRQKKPAPVRGRALIGLKAFAERRGGLDGAEGALPVSVKRILENSGYCRSGFPVVVVFAVYVITDSPITKSVFHSIFPFLACHHQRRASISGGRHGGRFGCQMWEKAIFMTLQSSGRF